MSAWPAIRDFYDPAARETLLVVPLYDEVDAESLKQFIADLGTRALVFLRSIRRVALIDLDTGDALVDHQLHERQRRSVKLDVHGHKLEVGIVELTDRLRGQTYARYLAEMPLKSEERPDNKATGPTTTLGVSVPPQPEQGLLYDRLPLPVPCELPVGLNAQFDPDTAPAAILAAGRGLTVGMDLAAVARPEETEQDTGPTPSRAHTGRYPVGHPARRASQDPAARTRHSPPRRPRRHRDMEAEVPASARAAAVSADPTACRPTSAVPETRPGRVPVRGWSCGDTPTAWQLLIAHEALPRAALAGRALPTRGRDTGRRGAQARRT